MEKAREGYLLKSDSDAKVAALQRRVDELEKSKTAAVEQATQATEQATEATAAQSRLERELAAVRGQLEQSSAREAKLVASVRHYTSKIIGKFLTFAYLSLVGDFVCEFFLVDTEFSCNRSSWSEG